MVMGLETDHLGWILQMGGAIAQEMALSVMDRAPHALNMERAQEFNELVLGWLEANVEPSQPQAPHSAQPTPS